MDTVVEAAKNIEVLELPKARLFEGFIDWEPMNFVVKPLIIKEVEDKEPTVEARKPHPKPEVRKQNRGINPFKGIELHNKAFR